MLTAAASRSEPLHSTHCHRSTRAGHRRWICTQAVWPMPSPQRQILSQRSGRRCAVDAATQDVKTTDPASDLAELDSQQRGTRQHVGRPDRPSSRHIRCHDRDHSTVPCKRPVDETGCFESAGRVQAEARRTPPPGLGSTDPSPPREHRCPRPSGATEGFSAASGPAVSKAAKPALLRRASSSR